MNLTMKRLPDWKWDWDTSYHCPECHVPLTTSYEARATTPDDEHGESRQYTALVCSEACAQEFAKHPVQSLAKGYAP